MNKDIVAIVCITLLFSLFSYACDGEEGYTRTLFESADPREIQSTKGEYTVSIPLLMDENESGKKVQAIFLDKNLVLLRKEIVKRNENNMTWRGKVDGEKLSDVTFTIVNGFLQGRININAETYSISPKKNGNYWILKTDKFKAIKKHNDALIPPLE